MKIHCPTLSQFSHLKHAFFEEDPHILTLHKSLAMEDMAGHPIPLVTLTQVHGTQVVHVNKPLTKPLEGDGLVTALKGIAVGILTADCGPILFYDPIAGVIGACHAGWRGAKNGIIQATIQAMEEQGGVRSQIYATLGPTIHQMNYEVGPEFPAFFKAPYDTFFVPSETTGHHYFNLPLYIAHQISHEGITHFHDLERNTFTENFASRRQRLSLGTEGISYCNLSAIAIM